jgi:hypothetical protein
MFPLILIIGIGRDYLLMCGKKDVNFPCCLLICLEHFSISPPPPLPSSSSYFNFNKRYFQGKYYM